MTVAITVAITVLAWAYCCRRMALVALMLLAMARRCWPAMAIEAEAVREQGNLVGRRRAIIVLAWLPRFMLASRRALFVLTSCRARCAVLLEAWA